MIWTMIWYFTAVATILYARRWGQCSEYLECMTLVEISLLELVLMHKLSRKCSFPCAKVLGTCTLLLSSILGFWKVVGLQTFTRAKVFVIFHLLFWPAFIWQNFLKKKNLVRCLLKNKVAKGPFLYYVRVFLAFSRPPTPSL